MQCAKAIKILLKNPDALSDTEKRKITSHLERCERCMERAKRLSDFEQVIQSSRELRVPAGTTRGFSDTVMRDIRTGHKKRKPIEQKPGLLPKPAIAFGLGALTVCFFVVWMILTKQPKPHYADGYFEPSSDIVIESAEIDGRDARVMAFRFDDPALTVIWIE